MAAQDPLRVAPDPIDRATSRRSCKPSGSAGEEGCALPPVALFAAGP